MSFGRVLGVGVWSIAALVAFALYGRGPGGKMRRSVASAFWGGEERECRRVWVIFGKIGHGMLGFKMYSCS